MRIDQTVADIAHAEAVLMSAEAARPCSATAQLPSWNGVVALP